MRMKSGRSWALALVVGAFAAPSLVGCVGQVTGGGSGGEGGEGGAGAADGSGGSLEAGGDPGTSIPVDPDPGTTTGGGGTGGYAFNAIALGADQLDPGSGGSGGFGSSGSGRAGPYPDVQFLRYGTGTELPTCSEPYGSGGCGGWSVSISIATAQFQPGTYPFASSVVDISFSESVSEGDDLCSGGGGGGLEEGQLEIYEITDTTVSFAVTGTNAGFDFDANGEFVAQRCQ